MSEIYSRFITFIQQLHTWWGHWRTRRSADADQPKQNKPTARHHHHHGHQHYLLRTTRTSQSRINGRQLSHRWLTGMLVVVAAVAVTALSCPVETVKVSSLCWRLNIKTIQNYISSLATLLKHFCARLLQICNHTHTYTHAETLAYSTKLLSKRERKKSDLNISRIHTNSFTQIGYHIIYVSILSC